MNLVGIEGHGEAEGRVGEELGHNHRRRSRSDLVPAATVRGTCLAGIDYFWPPWAPISISMGVSITTD